jgi:D-alanyl-D-alanine carboxypeptidase (penicillin-binding protein 5/6)
VPKPKERSKAAKALLEWGFAAWEDKPLVAAGARIGAAKVQGGASETVGLIAPRGVFNTLPKGGNAPVSLQIVYKGPLTAPIAKGAPVAELEVRIGDAAPARLPLNAAEDVAVGGPMDRLRIGFARLFS